MTQRLCLALCLSVASSALADDHRLVVGGGAIEVSINGSASVSEAALLDWIQTSTWVATRCRRCGCASAPGAGAALATG